MAFIIHYIYNKHHVDYHLFAVDLFQNSSCFLSFCSLLHQWNW